MITKASRIHYGGRPTLSSPPRLTLFDVDTCETCGGVVQAANAVGLDARSAAQLIAAGVPLWRDEQLPPEQYYDEETDRCACFDCNGQVETETFDVLDDDGNWQRVNEAPSSESRTRSARHERS